MNIEIETTNRCQCKCTFCLRSIEPPEHPSVIEDEVFRKIVLSSKDMNIRTVYLTGLGDPFLDLKIEERIGFVRKHLPESRITLYTNGVNADSSRLLDCVSRGLDDIYFSVNAASQGVHEQVMGIDGKFEQVKKNVIEALRVPGLQVIISTISGMQFIEGSEIEKIYSQWPEGSVFSHLVCNWAGRIFKLKYLPQSNYCRWHKETMHFNLKGDMCLCCFDPYNKYGFGNIMDKGMSVKNLWFGEKRTNFLRRLQDEGRKWIIPCNQCTTV